jgi:hypothetical protein
MTTTVAALYIDPRGPYPKMADVDCWDEARDARLYDGPHPVVAHPPCGPWSALRHLSRAASDVAECGVRAIDQVKAFGGVLEQPASSRLFAACGIPESALLFVEQVSWGHVARKATALLFVGVEPTGILTGGTPTHWCSGGRRRSSGSGGIVPPGIKVCSSQQRRRTPIAFAEWLVSLARTVSPWRQL